MMGAVSNILQKRGHPGSSGKKTRGRPKGRQINPQALEEIEQLIGGQTRRDLLIEYLHQIQDNRGYLSSDHLAALAHHMRLALTEVYEVATFYAHFDIVRDDEPRPPGVTIRVCDSISCQLAGADRLLEELHLAREQDVRVVRAPCMGRCDMAPVAEVGHNHICRASTTQLLDAARDGEFHPAIPDYADYNRYQSGGGYQLLASCLAGDHTPDQIIESLNKSSLQGLGGAGFPTGQKWGIVRNFAGPRLMAVNGDEGEPGTFKDRFYMETDPHRFIEGMLIAAWAVDVETCYIYIRDEYPAIIKILHTELAKVSSAGLSNHVKIEIRRGAGAYICGEESSMIESIEGKRGIPRNRPPYVAEEGIFGRPTLVNNLETLYWVRDIIEKGPQWFSAAGTNGRKGWRSYSVSGRVNNPGMKLAPAGITVNDLIENYCGGMIEGHQFKGYLPGGASGGILPASLGDVALDFGTLQEYGCFIGSAAVVIFSHRDNMKNVALNLMRFFEDESCGQCTPCRAGTEKAVQLMAKPKWDTELLDELGKVMTDASICGLGQAAGNPIFSVLKHFKKDL